MRRDHLKVTLSKVWQFIVMHGLVDVTQTRDNSLCIVAVRVGVS